MSDLPPRCKGLFGRRLCKWEGRYDYAPPSDRIDMGEVIFGMAFDVKGSVSRLRALGKQTYVREVCTRCGQTKERTI